MSGKRTHRSRVRAAALLAALMLAPAAAQAQQAPLVLNKGFSTVREILAKNCSSCHTWAQSYQGIADPKRVTPRSPDSSPLWTFLADGSMPPSGPGLAADQRALIRAWIAAGAPTTDDPLVAASADATAAATPAPAQPAADTVTAATEAAPAGQTADATAAPTPAEAGPSDAVSAATGSQAPDGTAKLSPYARRLRFHEISGFTSGGLLLASGVAGAVHFLNMMDAAHAYRDAHGIDDVVPECSIKIRDAWAGDQALRWVHVGLFSSGELLYLADAITGLSMRTPDRPGLTRQDIHRYAFFTHAALMAAELVLGFLTTDALNRGDHNRLIALGAAHTGIGIAIPVIILGAGVYASVR